MTAEDVLDRLPQLIRHRDGPVSEPSDVPIFLLAREASKSVKMVLTGEGSDELLAGYPKHRVERLMRLYRSMVPAALDSRLLLPLARRLPPGRRRLRIACESLALRDRSERFPRWFGALSRDERAALMLRPGGDRPGCVRPFTTADGQSDLRRMLYFDQTSWLPDNLLERGDRMTMAASIEARMPFVDPGLAALLSRLPDRYRLRGLTTKWILRQAVRDLLPAEILTRPKVGFFIPVHLWFRTRLRDLLHDSLLGPDSVSAAHYRRPVLERLLDEHGSGRRRHEKTLWTLLNLELFLRAYRLS